jgi:hypothetical protein
MVSAPFAQLFTAFFPLVLGVAAGCSGSAPPSDHPRPDAQRARVDIDRVLDDWHDAAAHSDEARYFAHFAQGGVFLGTDATERWGVAEFRAYAHPFFSAGKGWVMRSTKRFLAFADDGRTAWFDEALETKNLGPARGSGVMMLGADGAWRIAQYVLSITVPNERFGEVKKLLEAK